MAIKITRGNSSDLSQAPGLAKDLVGKLFGDKGYISKNLFAKLYKKGFMKNHLLDIGDKNLLRKRSLIESVFNVLKNGMNLEHTRHRSPLNFLIHIVACVTAYAIKKLPCSLVNESLSMHSLS